MNDIFKLTILIMGVLLFAALVLGKCGADLSGHTRAVATKEAETYLKELGLTGRVRCADVDTDGDGYVSCPYVVDGSPMLHPLECAGSLTINNGCRLPKIAPAQAR